MLSSATTKLRNYAHMKTTGSAEIRLELAEYF